MAKSAAKIVTIASEYVRSRKSVRSIIGSALRRSSTTNATRAAAATAKRASIPGDVQPARGPSITAYANAPTAATKRSCPGTSNVRGRSSRDSATNRDVSPITTIPTGTLTWKMLRQPVRCTMKPPSVGPMAMAVLAIAVQMPIAHAFTFASGNAALTSASEVTLTVAAATPWTARAAFSMSSDVASPQATEEIVKRAMPARYSLLRPNMSASVPADMMEIAMPRLYAVTTHCRPDSPTRKSDWIAGSATFTISASRKIMKRPRPVAARVKRCVRFMDFDESFSQEADGRPASGRPALCSRLSDIRVKEATMKRHATAEWRGDLKTGKGSLTTESGVLSKAAYSFTTRFEGEKGTNPEELVAAAHAGCFTMAMSAELGKTNLIAESLKTTAVVSLEKDAGGWSITESQLELVAKIPGASQAAFQAAADSAKANCPLSKLLKAKITLTARLEG